jgi:GNAT superfamily N-acetyltransferase
MDKNLKVLPNLKIRRFRDSLDYKIISLIRNKSAQKYSGSSTSILHAEQIRDLMASPDRVRIAEANGEPIGFIFVMKEGSIQLDEYGTFEGRSWLILGPIILPEYEKTEVGKILLNHVIDLAREKNISSLIRIVKATKIQEYLRTLLTNEKFHIEQRYYRMKLELKKAPSLTRKVPAELELMDYNGEEDFDKLWSILKAAFDYGENEEEKYEHTKKVFGSLTPIYMPICIETQSQLPIGTIAAVRIETSSGIHSAIATFGVIPAFQGKGIGSMLMERAINQCWKYKITTIELAVRAKNPQALVVYKHFRFRVLPEHTTLVFIKNI